MCRMFPMCLGFLLVFLPKESFLSEKDITNFVGVYKLYGRCVKSVAANNLFFRQLFFTWRRTFNLRFFLQISSTWPLFRTIQNLSLALNLRRNENTEFFDCCCVGIGRAMILIPTSFYKECEVFGNSGILYDLLETNSTTFYFWVRGHLIGG